MYSVHLKKALRKQKSSKPVRLLVVTTCSFGSKSVCGLRIAGARTVFNMQFGIVFICYDYRLGLLVFHSEPFIQKISYSEFEFIPY